MYLVVHHGRLVSLMTTVGLGVITTSIVLMAARFAMLTAALSLLFLWLSQREHLPQNNDRRARVRRCVRPLATD